MEYTCIQRHNTQHENNSNYKKTTYTNTHISIHTHSLTHIHTFQYTNSYTKKKFFSKKKMSQVVALIAFFRFTCLEGDCFALLARTHSYATIINTLNIIIIVIYTVHTLHTLHTNKSTRSSTFACFICIHTYTYIHIHRMDSVWRSKPIHTVCSFLFYLLYTHSYFALSLSLPLYITLSLPFFSLPFSLFFSTFSRVYVVVLFVSLLIYFPCSFHFGRTDSGFDMLRYHYNGMR